jgi:hypothetical protein
MIEYHGKPIGFKRTIGAISDLTKLAPNGRVDRLGEIFSEEKLDLTLESGVHFLAILNKWYEKSLAFENKDYTPDPVPEEWFMMLDMDDFTELMNEAMRQFQEDDKTTIEATELKGKKNG